MARKTAPQRLDGLGSVQRTILLTLSRRGGSATRRQLMEALKGTTPSTVYAALNALERRDLIVRERHPRPQPTIIRLKEK